MVIRGNEHTLVRIRGNEYIKSSQKLEWGNEHIIVRMKGNGHRLARIKGNEHINIQ